MKQEFHTERRFHFNLRKPKGERATPIYIVVFIGGKQYKLSTNVKVNPLHWDSAKQMAIVSNTNSRLDNKNNRIVNERLEQVKGYYLEFIDYLCSREETPSNVGEVLKSYIYKDMANKKTISIDVIKTIKEAFNYYYRNIRQVKESTQYQNERILNMFIDYIKENKLNNSVEVFKQGGLNAYKAYNVDLKEKGEIGIERINKRCELIERLINNVLVVNDEYSQFDFTPVTFVKMEDKRQQDEIGRVPLFDEEIQAIKDCQSLTDKEKEYRTIFLLQCASGQRESDLIPIVRGEYEIKDDIITLQTIKKGTYAQIYVTDEIRGYLHEAKEIKLINLDKFSNSQYNNNIKNICKKAGLNRVIDWKDAKGKKQSSQLWEIVSSHYARHTFITNKVKEGVPYEKLILMSGHSDDKMIKEVYSHLTKEDKADKVREYYNTTGAKEREESKKKDSTSNNKTSSSKVDVFKELFAISELEKLRDMRANGINIFDEPEIKVIYRKLKDTKLLSIAMEQKENIPAIDEELSKLIWKICRANYETKAYVMFQYKCLKLRLSDEKPIPEDELGYIWDEEMRDIQENWQTYEYLNIDK